MDTGTHLVFGLGIAGLAYVDPVIAGNATAAVAVLIGAVVGQQAPDFDTILRMKSNASYVKNHRGLSHSLPAVALWTVLITGLLQLVFGGKLPIWHVGFWVFIAVATHVFSDLFNSYGTQAFRPITRRWISWNIIHIFDPFLFAAHAAAIVLWALNVVSPAVIFPVLYMGVALYYIARSVIHAQLERRLPRVDATWADGDRGMLIPTISPRRWNVLKKRADGSYMLGELRSGRLQWIDKARCQQHPAIDKSRQHPDIAAFLSFSEHVCAEVRSHSWGYEVRWADVRYRHRKNYPFVAIVLLDRELAPIDSFIGWMSESRVVKKLGLDSAG